MNRIKRAMYSATAFLCLAAPAWATEEVPPSNAVKIISGLLPLFIIFGLLYFGLRRINRKNGPYMDRAVVHMDRLEKQNEEIIELLKDIAGKG